mgnify:CR=1 FL=1
MAIHFEWYENPVPPNRPDEKKLHARITYNGKVGTDYVRRKIQERCSLTETDVTAVLDALSHVLGQELGDGRQVHLDGIGYFHPTLKCIEEVTAETKRKNTKVRLKGIKFRADQVLKNEIGAIKVKPLGLNEHSQKLSDKEIDRRLTGYFSTHQFLTRESFQVLCGMMRSTAQLHIRLLRSEGKLENVGKLNQPIYVPCTGYYGRDE